MGPQHGLIGEDFGVDLPVMQVPERDLTIEKNAAKFSRTKEFQNLKRHLEERIATYQTFLPDGRVLSGPNPTAEDWRVANLVIAEFKAVIAAYENAQQVVEEAAKHDSR